MKQKYLYLVALVIALLVSGCDNVTKKDVNEQVKTVEVVINENAFPFSFVDDNGSYSGYDGELLGIIAQKLPQYNFHFNAVSRDAMLIGLSTGTYNLAANHFYINKERAKSYNYSKEPSGLSDLRLIVNKDNDTIHSLDDVATLNKSLVPIHVSDARYQVIADYNKTHPNKPIVLKGTGEQTAVDIFKSVASGEYDAAIYPVGAFIAIQKQLNLPVKIADSVEVVPTVFLYNNAAANQPLQQVIDKVLIELKNDGTLEKLSTKWLGSDVYALAGAKAITVPNYSE